MDKRSGVPHAKRIVVFTCRAVTVIILLAGILIFPPVSDPASAEPLIPADTWHALDTGLNDNVYAIGVAGADVYIGGQFTDAGGPSGPDYLARWDAYNETWNAVGGGFTSAHDGGTGSVYVRAIEVVGPYVYVGGDFASVGGVADTFGLARWNTVTSTWESVCGGINGTEGYTVYAIESVGSDIFIGGYLNVDLGVGGNTYGVARCDGTDWNEMWTDINGNVFALKSVGSKLYVGGNFPDVDDIPDTEYIAYWDIDTETWHALASGINDDVLAIAVEGQNVYLGGEFYDVGTSDGDGIVYWDGSSWNALGSGMDNNVYSISVIGGDVYAGGWFGSAGGVPFTNHLARWDGAAWHALSSYPSNSVQAIEVEGSQIYAGGNFTGISGVANTGYIARYDITESAPDWSALGSGLNNNVEAIVSIGSDLYVGGWFTNAGGISAADHIARWDGENWHALGGGLNNNVYDMIVVGSDIYVAGAFFNAGDVEDADYIARWDTSTSTWHAVGSGVNGTVYAVDNQGGTFYIGGVFTSAGGVTGTNRVAYWEDSAWHAMDNGLSNTVLDIEVAGEDVYVAGQFTSGTGFPAPKYIIRWDGSWHALGSDTAINSQVQSVDVVGRRVYAGGVFTNAGGNSVADKFAYFDGVNWQSMETADLDDPDQKVYFVLGVGPYVYVGGSYDEIGGIPGAQKIAYWNGNGYSALGGGLNGAVYRVYPLGSQVYVGGQFTDAGGDTEADHIACFGSITRYTYLPAIIKP